MIFSILTVVFITELCKLIEALKKRIRINGHKKGKKLMMMTSITVIKELIKTKEKMMI